MTATTALRGALVRSPLPTPFTRGRSRARRVERRATGQPPRERFRPLVSVVIPARNEQQNLEWVFERLPSVHEVILVDGCSTDDTVAVARSLRPDIVVLSDHGRGKGDALRIGFNAASGHFIVMLDADGSMDPGEIPRYIDALMDGHDVVKGSRLMPGGGSDDLSRLRSAGNFGLCQLVNGLYGAHFTDLCYGYFAFRRSCLPLMKLWTDGFEIETEIVVCSLKAGLRITEVPSHELQRRHGASNLNAARDGARVLSTLLHRRVAHVPRRLRNPWAGYEATPTYDVTPSSRPAAPMNPPIPSTQTAGRASRRAAPDVVGPASSTAVSVPRPAIETAIVQPASS